jgi:membrane-associated protease RseP (regulator of RpoE activity)
MLLWVNVFWGLINLIPVFPLDGGQVSRALFVEQDPWDGYRKSLWVSVIAGGVMAVVGLIFLGSIWLAFLFGILALQGYMEIQGRGGLGF